MIKIVALGTIPELTIVSLANQDDGVGILVQKGDTVQQICSITEKGITVHGVMPTLMEKIGIEVTDTLETPYTMVEYD